MIKLNSKEELTYNKLYADDFAQYDQELIKKLVHYHQNIIIETPGLLYLIEKSIKRVNGLYKGVVSYEELNRNNIDLYGDVAPRSTENVMYITAVESTILIVFNDYTEIHIKY